MRDFHFSFLVFLHLQRLIIPRVFNIKKYCTVITHTDPKVQGQGCDRCMHVNVACIDSEKAGTGSQILIQIRANYTF